MVVDAEASVCGATGMSGRAAAVRGWIILLALAPALGFVPVRGLVGMVKLAVTKGGVAMILEKFWQPTGQGDRSSEDKSNEVN